MEKNIFRLYISMYDILFMHILNSLTDLFDDLLDWPFSNSVLLILDALIKVISQTRLKEQIYVGAIYVEVVKLDNVGMIEV